MTITYNIETLDEYLEEIEPLLQEHYKEICSHPDYLVLNPCYESYYKLEEAGVLRSMIVRDDGNIVGYFISFVMPNIHYSDRIYAHNDILYVDPAYRGGTTGYRMLKNAIDDLKSNCGVDVLCVHMKVKYPFRNLLKAFGFTNTEENWEVIL